MRQTVDREKAWEIFTRYNKGAYRHEHAQIMERTLRYFAEELGYGDEVEYWGVVGLLHDLDYELYPEKHCIEEQRMMREEGLGEDVIRAAASHGYGKSVTIEPEHTMEKLLYLANELTVLIDTTAKAQPSKKLDGLALDAVKQAYDNADYASTYAHLVIERGLEMLGWNLDETIKKMLSAMRGENPGRMTMKEMKDLRSLTDTYELQNGVRIPCVGYGTFRTPNGEATISGVKNALSLGYRHIDTAAGYNNEEGVGTALKESGMARDKVFVTSKLQNTAHGYEETKAAFEQTMKNLDMEYLDLYLVHWPNPIKYRDSWRQANAGTWKAFEELYKSGRIRAIGVSNFFPHHLDELMKTASVAPMVNQIFLCPGETQDKVVDDSRSRGIVLEAYSPLGAGQIFEVPEMKTLAQKYGKSIAQICVRWSLQRGYLPLPKSVTPSRIKENAEVFDFELSPEDVTLIANMKGVCGYARNPDEITF